MNSNAMHSYDRAVYRTLFWTVIGGFCIVQKIAGAFKNFDKVFKGYRMTGPKFWNEFYQC